MSIVVKKRITAKTVLQLSNTFEMHITHWKVCKWWQNLQFKGNYSHLSKFNSLFPIPAFKTDSQSDTESLSFSTFYCIHPLTFTVYCWINLGDFQENRVQRHHSKSEHPGNLKCYCMETAMILNSWGIVLRGRINVRLTVGPVCAKQPRFNDTKTW